MYNVAVIDCVVLHARPLPTLLCNITTTPIHAVQVPSCITHSARLKCHNHHQYTPPNPPCALWQRCHCSPTWKHWGCIMWMWCLMMTLHTMWARGMCARDKLLWVGGVGWCHGGDAGFVCLCVYMCMHTRKILHTHSLTHTHSLPLSLSLTHTHTLLNTPPQHNHSSLSSCMMFMMKNNHM